MIVVTTAAVDCSMCWMYVCVCQWIWPLIWVFVEQPFQKILKVFTRRTGWNHCNKQYRTFIHWHLLIIITNKIQPLYNSNMQEKVALIKESYGSKHFFMCVCLCASMCVYSNVYYLSVWEVVVPDIKSFLSVQCKYQNRMEVYLGDKKSLDF